MRVKLVIEIEVSAPRLKAKDAKGRVASLIQYGSIHEAFGAAGMDLNLDTVRVSHFVRYPGANLIEIKE